MALTRLTIDGYGQLELNNVAFRRDGRIEAQCALDTTDFAKKPAENGMILAVDATNKVIKFVKTDNKELPIAINYSAEHLYDAGNMGLKNFCLKPGQVYPRLGYLSVGDKFTTNCIGFEEGGITDESDLIKKLGDLKTNTIYGTTSEEGAIKVTTEKPAEGLVLKVIKWYTMPDGQPGVKFQVLSV